MEKKEIVKRYSFETSNNCLSCANNLNYLQAHSGDVVLDLGCGSGQETIAVAKAVGLKGLVFGLDLTENMIKAAQDRAASEGVYNVEFLQGDIEELPFREGSFDKVMSNCVINHSPNKLQVFEEIYRVLKKEGYFIVSDVVSKEPLPSYIKNDPYQWSLCFGGAITEEEYLNIIRDAKFKDIRILNRREYLKNGFDFISLTFQGYKV